jgi:hypothetical protein
VNKESPERVHLVVHDFLIDNHLIRPCDLLMHQQTRIPKCDTKGRMKKKKKKKTRTSSSRVVSRTKF